MAGTVLVTGGTGYIAGEVIDQLLGKGWCVRTTVRSKAKSEARLRGRWPGADDRLYVFEADLMSDAGWDLANEGCTHVAHVASPFPVGVPKDEDELIVPAREGTLRALRFAQAAGVMVTLTVTTSVGGRVARKFRSTSDRNTSVPLSSLRSLGRRVACQNACPVRPSNECLNE